MCDGDHILLVAVMEFPQDIDILADLLSLEGLLQVRHPFRSEDHVAVRAEGAFEGKRGFTGGTPR
ncbi:MAG: hypothetical protein ACREI5_07575 [Candidatus Methylomirabilales bacterium]